MNLFNIHCGFYDEELSEGVYEFHVNLFIAAETIEDAKRKVRTVSSFQKKKMHIDGIEEIQIVDGYKIELVAAGCGENKITQHLHRDL